MSRLQIGLIVAGVLLVIGVLVYNWWQERRVRSRLAGVSHAAPAGPATAARVEPTLRSGEAAPVAASAAVPGTEVAHDPDWRAPMDDVVRLDDAAPPEPVRRRRLLK